MMGNGQKEILLVRPILRLVVAATQDGPLLERGGGSFTPHTLSSVTGGC